MCVSVCMCMRACMLCYILLNIIHASICVKLKFWTALSSQQGYCCLSPCQIWLYSETVWQCGVHALMRSFWWNDWPDLMRLKVMMTVSCQNISLYATAALWCTPVPERFPVLLIIISPAVLRSFRRCGRNYFAHHSWPQPPLILLLTIKPCWYFCFCFY